MLASVQLNRKSSPPSHCKTPRVKVESLFYFSPVNPHGIALSLVQLLSTQGCLHLIYNFPTHTLLTDSSHSW